MRRKLPRMPKISDIYLDGLKSGGKVVPIRGKVA